MDQTTTFVLILFVVALLGLGFCIYWILRLKHRFEAAFANLDSKQNLSDTVTEYFTKLGATAKKLDNLQKSYGHLSDIGARSIQKTAVVRFNPFRNTGGDQSFVLALLDNNDSGFLLTSIHSREGTRVYIKSIEYGNAKHNLSAEEQQALKQSHRAGAEPAEAKINE